MQHTVIAMRTVVRPSVRLSNAWIVRDKTKEICVPILYRYSGRR